MNISGFCDARFAEVEYEFRENFASRGEVGASVCVLLDGHPVVDLWGGLADPRSGKPWERDTLGVVFSCTKGAVALCAHLLVIRGLLDLDTPVSRYWPEFAAHGKESILVRWVLDHQAGVPVLRHPLPAGSAYHPNLLLPIVVDETPFWEPGTRQGYHAFTFGYLLGELVRRITGKTIGAFLHEEITAPHGVEFYLGLPEHQESRIAPTIRADPLRPGEVPWRVLEKANQDRESLQALLVRNHGRGPGGVDSREAHAAQLPSQGGISHARGLAHLYSLTMSPVLPFAETSALLRMQEVSSASACDAVLLVGLRFSLGFMKSSDNRAASPGARDSLLLSPTAFGHAGMGGSLGFADPSCRLAFGYTMNKQGRGVLLNERGQTLVDATYRALGFRLHPSGFWS